MSSTDAFRPRFAVVKALLSTRRIDAYVADGAPRQKEIIYETCLNPCTCITVQTRLSSDPRPTTRECVHLVTRGHFWSRCKHGGHTIRSAMAENPMLQANFTSLCFIEPEFLPIEVLHCGNGDFDLFCSCDLDLDL